MTLLARLLRRLLGIAADAAVDEAREQVTDHVPDLVGRLRGEKPMPLSHKDVEHQQAQIREATRWCRSCVVGEMGGHKCGLSQEQILANLERRAVEMGAIEPPTSPRAITARHCIVPPPRKPRT